MAIEIVDLPSYKMVMFHSFLYVYQKFNKFWSPTKALTQLSDLKLTSILATNFDDPQLHFLTLSWLNWCNPEDA